MTERERRVVRKAIDDLLDNGPGGEGDFAGAVAALCRLVGQRYPAGELDRKALRPVDVREVASRQNSSFGAKP